MILTYEQLSDSTLDVCTPRSNYWSVIFDSFKAFRNTGCRSTELLDIGRWSRIDLDTIQLQPLKGNSPRQIEASVLPTSYLNWIDGTIGDYQMLTTGKLEYFMNKFYRWPLASKGNKQSCLYLFRYYYVKTLAENGMSTVDIKSHMGWSDESIALGYINAVIQSS